MMGSLRWWALGVSALLVTLGGALLLDRGKRTANLDARLSQIVPVQSEPELSCAELVKRRPLVLLALGQSNAGNHGAMGAIATAPVALIAEGKCISAVDPLPGGTGRGGSIWGRLPLLLSQSGLSRPVVLSVLAVDASSMDEWTRDGSGLKRRLIEKLESMRRLGLGPDLVLWQQGEADTRAGTSVEDYNQGLNRLVETFTLHGVFAPVVLARSTVCRSSNGLAVGAALNKSVASSARMRLGPDTDSLTGEAYRLDGCHFAAAGLEAAAKMWNQAILFNLPADHGR